LLLPKLFERSYTLVLCYLLLGIAEVLPPAALLSTEPPVEEDIPDLSMVDNTPGD